MPRIFHIFVFIVFPSLAFGQSIWTSSQEHYFGAASCHPHCHPGNGDIESWQEAYPAYLDNKHFSLSCHGNGHTGNPCALDNDATKITLDTTDHIATVTFLNRSDEIWVRLTAE